MAISAEKLVTFARGVLGDDPSVPKLPVEKYLEAIPRLSSLADLPSGTPVLVRGDVDAKPGPKVGEGDIRLRSMNEHAQFRPQAQAGRPSSSGISAASPRSRSPRSPSGWAKFWVAR